jgi:hypothetical protein
MSKIKKHEHEGHGICLTCWTHTMHNLMALAEYAAIEFDVALRLDTWSDPEDGLQGQINLSNAEGQGVSWFVATAKGEVECYHDGDSLAWLEALRNDDLNVWHELVQTVHDAGMTLHLKDTDLIRPNCDDMGDLH